VSGQLVTTPSGQSLSVEQVQPERVRVVCFMTDGLVGNDFAIIDAIKKNAGSTRVFSFGIGDSVNRFLIEGMAFAGRGRAEVVTLPDDQAAAADRLYAAIHAPLLTDIAIDWGTLGVEEIYPIPLPDLFSARPIMIHGRLKNGTTSGTITLRGQTGAGPFERKIALQMVDPALDSTALASIWARAKVEQVMHQDLAALQSGSFPDALKRQITDLGVQYNLMTQFTSFVAVDESEVTTGGQAQTVAVPAELPEGMAREGVEGSVAIRKIQLSSIDRFGRIAGGGQWR